VIGLAGVSPPAPVTSILAGVSVEPSELAALPGPASQPAATTTRSARPDHQRAAAPGQRTLASTRAKPSTHTSCRAVVHIGDSTSEGLISNDYLPDPAQQIGAQYARVGVRDTHFEITGATSIVETLPGGLNAYEVARGLTSDGYRGCWVIALGTNDTADVYVGSSVGLSARIKEMMSVIGDQPVMWVNVKSLVGSGPYAEDNMLKWNAALLQACAKYPNMRIFDWASAVRDNWFISDGIHFTSLGYAARAHLIANALAQAFPASGPPSPNCTVEEKSISIRVRGVGP